MDLRKRSQQEEDAADGSGLTKSKQPSWFGTGQNRSSAAKFLRLSSDGRPEASAPASTKGSVANQKQTGGNGSNHVEGSPVPEKNEAAVLDALPLDPDVIAKIQAQNLDDYVARLQRQQLLDQKDEKSKIICKPHVNRNDPNYRMVRKHIRERLKIEAPMTIMDGELDEVQKSLLLSPINDSGGFLLHIQELHSLSYKVALQSPKWKGEMDNMATKLTMAKFGLPVQPITVSNQLALINPDEDQDDPEDKEDTVPPIQRVQNSETPLKFLDDYWERFHGYPGNRRPQSNVLRLRGGSGSVEDVELYAGNAKRNGYRQEEFLNFTPFTSDLRLRGGGIPDSHTVYSYNGYAELPDGDLEGVIDASLRLLDESARNSPDGNASWTFKVEFFGVESNTGAKSRSVTINQGNYKRILHENEQAFKSCLVETASHHPDGGSQFLFVRRLGTPVPKSQIPTRNDHIVRLSRAEDNVGITAYWSLARNLDHSHGLNQVQDDFYKAMKILAGDKEFQGQVVINKCNLGYAGMEATQELWDAARKSLRSRQHSRSWRVSVRPVDHPAGLHLIGRSNIAGWKPQDYQGALNEIGSLFQGLEASESRDIEKIRVFPTLDARINGIGSDVIPLGDPAEAITRMRNLWISQPAHFTGRCLYFRPEFSRFHVQEAGNDANQVTWNLKDTLQPGAEFMTEIVPKLFPEFNPQKDCIMIPQIEPRENFVISPELRQESLRIFVFDHLNSERIHVSRGGDAYRDLTPIFADDGEKLWGFDHPRSVLKTAKSPVPAAPLLNIPTAGGNKAPVRADANTSLLWNGPRINQPRLVAARAMKPLQMAYKPWQRIEDEKEVEMQRAYTSFISVVNAGKQGRIPITNNLRELSINVGSSMPELFHQHRTPTEFKKLQDENITLRNQILRRQICCPICTETFPAYPQDDSGPDNKHEDRIDGVKRKHFRKHLEQCQSAGRCPLCDTDHFQYWSQDERKQHLDLHYSVWYNQVADEERDGVYCRVCFIKFSTDLFPKSRDIARHMETHVAGLKNHCDKCGLNVTNVNLEPWEQNQHLQQCTNAPNRCTLGWPKHEQRYKRADNPEDMFCPHCGIELEMAQKNEQTKEQHQRACDLKKKDPNKWKYCGKCGVLLSQPHITQKQQEAHAKKCIVPGGWPERYCIQCGLETGTLSDPQTYAEHARACRFQMPEFVDASLRPSSTMDGDHNCPTCKVRLPKDTKLLIAHIQTHSVTSVEGDSQLTQACRDGLKKISDELQKSSLRYQFEVPGHQPTVSNKVTEKEVNDLIDRLDAAIRNHTKGQQKSKQPEPSTAEDVLDVRAGAEETDIEEDNVIEKQDLFEADNMKPSVTVANEDEWDNEEDNPGSKYGSSRKRKRSGDRDYLPGEESSEDDNIEPEPEEPDLENRLSSSKKVKINPDVSFRPSGTDEDSEDNIIVSPSKKVSSRGKKASSTPQPKTIPAAKEKDSSPSKVITSTVKKGTASSAKKSTTSKPKAKLKPNTSTSTPLRRSSRSRSATPSMSTHGSYYISKAATSKKAATPVKRNTRSLSTTPSVVLPKGRAKKAVLQQSIEENEEEEGEEAEIETSATEPVVVAVKKGKKSPAKKRK